SSNRISKGIGSPAISSGIGCGTSHSITSPGLILSEGLVALPLTVTAPCSIRRWAAARERSAVWVLRKTSRRFGVSPAETVTRRGILHPSSFILPPSSFTLVPEEVQDQEAHAHGDRRIGHVEGGPVVAHEREVEEVDDFAGADAIDEVAD